MKNLSNNPNVIGEVWYDSWPEKTTLFLYVCGKSRLLTNHLSVVNFRILSGVAEIDTSDVSVLATPETEIAITPGSPYEYSGQFTALVDFMPGLAPNFVTHGDEKLGREQHKILRKAERQQRREETYSAVMGKILKQANVMELMNVYTEITKPKGVPLLEQYDATAIPKSD